MMEATMDELMHHIKAGGKLCRGMTRDDLLLKDKEEMTNEERFEQMFPSLVYADAFTIGGKRFVSMDKVLEIIDNGVKIVIVMECLKENGVFKDDGKVGDVARFGEWMIRHLSSGIKVLKGSEQE